MKRFLSLGIVILTIVMLALPCLPAYADSYEVSTDNAVVGQEYVLIIVDGEQERLELADQDERIRYIQQQSATSATLSFENIEPAAFEEATAFIISEEGVLVKCTLLENTAVSTIVLPAGTKVVEEEAFEGVSAAVIKLPDGLTTIRKRAFANCPGLQEVYIPRTVSTIEEDVFQNSPEVVIYGYPGSGAEEYASSNGIQFRSVE